MRFRLEQNSQRIRSVYRPERQRWTSQVLGCRRNPITLLGEDYVAAVVFGATDVEAERRAEIVRDALNAAQDDEGAVAPAERVA